MGKKILQNLFSGYLKFLKKTITIQWQEKQISDGKQIFGFWHEDSFFMNLVLEELAEQAGPIDVIVTADKRGDYIEHMIREYGGNALRVPDGFAAFAELKKILQNSYEQTRSIAVALDGPLGPRHEPKKLAFYLAEHEQEEFVGITVSYSCCLRLFWRWDHYAIPLPFTTVMVAAHDYGEVQKKQTPKLPIEAETAECDILLKDA